MEHQIETTLGSAAAAAGSRARLVYTRDELFRVVASMPGFETQANELSEYKDPDWTALQLELVAAEGHQLFQEPRRTLASFGRKRSELMAGDEPRSLTGALSGHKKLFRMTSSPSIRYNNSNNSTQNHVEALQQPLAGLSSQVRAKYARLLETMASSQAVDARHNAAPKLIARTSTVGQFPRPTADESGPRRPTQMFGPLRRRSDDNRRGSDEPMSLPYSINLNSTEAGGGGRARATRQSASFASLGADESPIKRIEAARDHESGGGATGQRNSTKFLVNGQLQEGDEDDFDITKLLSITVLSDIRTIRHDQYHTTAGQHHHHHHQQHSQSPGKLTRQASASGRLGTLQRTRSQESPAGRGLPERSNSSLEFGYSARSQQQQQQQRTRAGFAPNQQNFAAPRPAAYPTSLQQERERLMGYHQRLNEAEPEVGASGESESLPYSWQTNGAGSSSLYVNPEVALKYHLKSRDELERAKSRQIASKPVDEKTVKILETFKAQVRARAAEVPQGKPASESAADSDKQPPAVERVKQECEEQKLEPGGQRNSTTNQNDKNITNSSETSTKDDKVESERAKTKVEHLREPERVQDESAQKQEHAEISASASTTEPKQSHAAPPRAPLPSNIPRLMALYRSRSNPPQPEKLDGATTTQPATTTSNGPLAGGANSRSNIKPGGKFVSQYKELRGKSLADEVQETSK